MSRLALAFVCASIFLYNSCLVHAQALSKIREGEFDIKLDALRASVASDFAGYGGFDDNVLTLDDRLPERTSIQSCRSVAEVLIATRDAFARYSLVEFEVSKQFPRNAVYFRRSAEGDNIKDVVSFYFTIEKQDGLNCKFTFGAFARTSVSKTKLHAPKRDEFFGKLLSNISSATADIEKALAKARTGVLFENKKASTTQSNETSKALNALRLARYSDHIFDAAIKHALAIILQTLPQYDVKISNIEIIVVNFDLPIAREIDRYRTGNCIAVDRDFEFPTIICNSHYLAEVEAVLRFFENASELGVRRTAAFRKLAADFGSGATSALVKLRRDPKMRAFSGQADAHITDHMAMALLFVLAHEVGHLLADTGPGALDDTAIADTVGYRTAILRLCRHSDQFMRSGFSLDLIDAATGDRSFVEKFRAQDGLATLVDQKFRDELAADAFGNDLVLKYFAQISKQDVGTAELQQYWFLQNLEALATYFWHKSYFEFTDLTCGAIVRTSGELSACLGLKPENFVAAADVFGRYHRNIFLRTIETFAGFLGERISFYEFKVRERVVIIGADDPAFAALSSQAKARAVRVMSGLQQYFLLQELVDTPLKLAFVGCELARAKEVRGGTVPMMIVQFFSYEQELSRFARKLGLK